MKFENEEIITKISQISNLYGKEAALGYAIGILETTKLDVIPSSKELLPEVRPAPNITPTKNLPSKLPEPAIPVDLKVGSIRKFESKRDETKLIKTRIIKAVNESCGGLSSSEISTCLSDLKLSKANIFYYVKELVKTGLLSDTETTIVHGRECAKYTMPNQIKGNVILTDNRKD